jgi:septal ring factor EnvC (AmiA/AmiB activator)
MEKRRIIYGASVIAIIVVIIAAVQINYLINRINTLEEEVSDLESGLSQNNDLVESQTEQLENMEVTISSLETELAESNQKNTEYLEKIDLLNTTIIILGGDASILDQLVGSIGPNEISTVLRAYGEKTLELQQLQKDYEELLLQYNNLLSQIN